LLFAGSTEIDHGSFTVTGLVTFQFYGGGEATTPGGRVSLPPDFLRRSRSLHRPRDECSSA
jgi:hypothetical protein